MDTLREVKQLKDEIKTLGNDKVRLESRLALLQEQKEQLLLKIDAMKIPRDKINEYVEKSKKKLDVIKEKYNSVLKQINDNLR